MADIDTALAQITARLDGYKHYAAYYDGDHDLAFATEKFNSSFAGRFSAFADNLCPRVVDALADRLKVEGFGVVTGDANIADTAWAIWGANNMAERAGEVHNEAFTAGDAYVIVWPNGDQEPIIYPNDACMMTVVYDQERPGVILWAAKCWVDQTSGLYRLNLYYPDRLEKYVAKGKLNAFPKRVAQFGKYQVDGEAWPYMYPSGWSGTVPVFHFTNNAKIGRPGRSELKPVIPLQDALNKSVLDMLVAAEFVALPQRWAVGMEVEYDELTGKPKHELQVAVDRLWTIASDTARFGEFQAANLAQFLDIQEHFRAEIARVSSTPLHYMMLQSGSFPSGEAMKTAEAPFLAKTDDRTTSFGSIWANVLELALKMKGVKVVLTTKWKDTAPRSDKEHTGSVIEKLEANIIDVIQAGDELGYSEQTVLDMQARRAASAADNPQPDKTTLDVRI